ncbi:MAG: Thioredoxin [Syntrophomonadaceae bacterium]|nr:Thioredoxin [Bacillota bacterium]
MSDYVMEIGDANFADEVLKSTIPVVVDFWAAWCGPCRMMAPVLDDMARELEGKVKVVKVNVDKNRTTAGNYKIMSIPTLMFFRGGQSIGNQVGFVSKEQLQKKIQEDFGV